MTETRKSLGTGVFNVTKTFTQLTTPGVTAAVNIRGMKSHTFQVTIATIDTNVSYQIEGSIDGTNFFTIPLQDFTATNISYTNEVATVTDNGTFLTYGEAIALTHIRFNFTAESGGDSSATFDVKYYGQS